MQQRELTEIKNEISHVKELASQNFVSAVSQIKQTFQQLRKLLDEREQILVQNAKDIDLEKNNKLFMQLEAF